MAGDTSHAERSTGLSLPLSGWTLDGIVAVLSLLMITGVALDFRAHAHGISFAEEGFLTPEHVFFYSMFLGIAAVLFAAAYQNRRAGATWLDAVPTGYAWGIAGVLLFGAAGFADFGWHSTFGFEEGIEALTSPSHLALATGAALFLSSPLRAAYRRDDGIDGVGTLAVVVSAALTLTVFTLFGLYLNPLINVHATSGTDAALNLGVSGMIVFPVLLVGTALALTRRFDLPTGALTGVFLLPALSNVVITGHLHLVVPAVVAGLVGDGLRLLGRPAPENPRALRAFGALVPLAFAVSYFTVVGIVWHIAWTVHIWTGAIVLAGMAGLLLTYVVVPDGTQVVEA
jgi:hypothetical protein